MDKDIKKPLVSVLMACYNSERYLKSAVDSILGQTYKNFEFIIINDGSTDRSLEILKSYTDSRIYLVNNEVNRGHTYSLNSGIKISKGKYIARMDSDDVSLPFRLTKQVEFMENNPDIAACGSWTKTIGKNKGQVNKYLTNPEDIKANLLFYTSLSHPTVILRKSALLKHNLTYSIDIDRDENSEDYALWVKLAQFEKLSNIPEVLLKFRVHNTNVSSIFKEKNRLSASEIRRRQLATLGLSPADEEMSIHNSVLLGDHTSIKSFIDAQEKWLKKIYEANKICGLYKQSSISKALQNRLYAVCSANTRYGLYTWIRYQSSSLTKINSYQDMIQTVKLMIRGLCKL